MESRSQFPWESLGLPWELPKEPSSTDLYEYELGRRQIYKEGYHGFRPDNYHNVICGVAQGHGPSLSLVECTELLEVIENSSNGAGIQQAVLGNIVDLPHLWANGIDALPDSAWKNPIPLICHRDNPHSPDYELSAPKPSLTVGFILPRPLFARTITSAPLVHYPMLNFPSFCMEVTLQNVRAARLRNVYTAAIMLRNMRAVYASDDVRVRPNTFDRSARVLSAVVSRDSIELLCHWTETLVNEDQNGEEEKGYSLLYSYAIINHWDVDDAATLQEAVGYIQECHPVGREYESGVDHGR